MGGGVLEAKKIINSISEDPNNTCYTEERFKFSLPKYDLSVIVPAYNSEKWIRRALDSIINQVTRYKFEIIIIMMDLQIVLHIYCMNISWKM